jgi:hypothetical protein
LPTLESRFRFEAPLVPSGVSFRAEKRGVIALGTKATEDEAVDRAFAIRMDLAPDAEARAILAPLVRPLAALAEIAPSIDVRADSLHVSVDGVHAERAPALLGATLDLWQSVNRARAGIT